MSPAQMERRGVACCGWRMAWFAVVLWVFLGRVCMGPGMAAGVGMVPVASLEVQRREGALLAAELRGQVPLPVAQGVLRTEAPGGAAAEVPIRLVSSVADSGLVRMEYLAGTGSGVARFLVFRGGGRTNRFELGLGGAGSTKEVSGWGLMRSFAGTEFWLADLGQDFFGWPDQRLVRKEMRKSRPCKVLESSPSHLLPVPDGVGMTDGYSRVVSWVDSETGGLLRAEAYDLKGRRLKSFSISKVAKVEGRWQLKQMRIYNYSTDRTTFLNFEVNLPGTVDPAGLQE